MDHVLNEDQRLLQASIERLIRERHSFEARRRIVAGAEGRSRELWRAFAEMGLLGLPFDERYGGLGGGPIETMIVMQAIGRGLIVEPYLQTVVLVGGLVRRGGSNAQKARFIPRIASGEAIYAFAYCEPRGRFNPADVTTTAVRKGSEWILAGHKAVVYGAPWAEGFFITARSSGARCDRAGITLFHVPAKALGLSLTAYPTMDGSRAAEVMLRDVRVGLDDVVGEVGEGLALVEQVLDDGAAAVCAEAAGAMQALTDKTLEYTKTRMSFDKPLSSYQVVQHRLVDMQVALAYSTAMSLLAARALDLEPASRSRKISVAKYHVCRDARFVGQNAIQLHGAMGMTDELDIGHYFRRLTVIDFMFGNADWHLQRYQRLNREAEGTRDSPKVEESSDERAFREEVRGFLEANITDEMRRSAQMVTWAFSEFEYGKHWQKLLHAKGWGAPYWPVQYGGCDWTPRQFAILEEEIARADPPRIMMMGRDLIAPSIMEFGTPEQKAYFLPRILAGEDWWAQGFSEPAIGSDLAALQLRAVADGDEYVLNGSKIWTTYAHHSNRIMLLVRTGTGTRKHAGISCLLVDTDTPGIEVRPIINIAGEHEFNQVFFTDVRVPRSRLLGAENEGWSLVRHFLKFEHGISARASAEMRLRLQWLRDLVRREGEDSGERLVENAGFAQHLADVEMAVDAVEFACAEAFSAVGPGDIPPPTLPLLNIRRREVEQRITELGIEAVGHYAAPFQPDARRAANAAPFVGPLHALRAAPFYLAQRAATIAGGTPEIQRNNLAKSLLGLR